MSMEPMEGLWNHGLTQETRTPQRDNPNQKMPHHPPSVFINCPFDKAYLTLLRPLVFTIPSLNLRPRFSLERADSGEIRLKKIIQLIKQSSFGIHDLSRCRASRAGEFYRMNMPLELGYDLGSKVFGGAKFSKKQVLILEQKRFSVQKAVSDLAGCDFKAHKNEPVEIVLRVRDWLVQSAKTKPTAANAIWRAFNEFMAWNYDDLKEKGWSKAHINSMAMNEMKDRMQNWLKKHPVA